MPLQIWYDTGFKMNRYKGIKDLTYCWAAGMILFGIVLILVAEIIEPKTEFMEFLRGFLEFIGIAFVSVFGVSLIYERYIAEKHFEDFKKMLVSQFEEMDSIQSKCMKLGIKEIFETRNAYEQKMPLKNIIEQSPEKSEIISVARSMYHLIGDRRTELEEGLKRGLKFKFACIDPKGMSEILKNVSGSDEHDIEAARNALKNLIGWAIETKPKGSIELIYHTVDLFDSVLLFTSEDGGKKLVWDLSFGRSFEEKRVMILDIYDNSLGDDLTKRYMTLLHDLKPGIKYSDGRIEIDEFGWF